MSHEVKVSIHVDDGEGIVVLPYRLGEGLKWPPAGDTGKVVTASHRAQTIRNLEKTNRDLVKQIDQLLGDKPVSEANPALLEQEINKAMVRAQEAEKKWADMRKYLADNAETLQEAYKTLEEYKGTLPEGGRDAGHVKRDVIGGVAGRIWKMFSAIRYL